MPTLKLTTESEDLIKQMSTIVSTDNKRYYYMPYWLEATDEPGVFIVHALDKQLPEDLLDAIHSHRLTGKH